MTADYGADPRDHFAVRVENMPPTAIICKCGATYANDDGIDCLDAMRAHMAALNEPPPNDGSRA